jgi:hypothetical protein
MQVDLKSASKQVQRETEHAGLVDARLKVSVDAELDIQSQIETRRKQLQIAQEQLQQMQEKEEKGKLEKQVTPKIELINFTIPN